MTSDQIQLIGDIEEFGNTGGDIRLLGHDFSSGKTAFVPMSAVTGQSHVCGVRFRNDSASPEGEPYGDLNLLANLPATLGLGGYLVSNDHSRRKLSPSNHFKLADGATAVLDGSMGHYQWGWNVPWYYAHWQDEFYTFEVVSPSPIAGHYNYLIPVASMSCAGAAALDRTNNILVSYCNRSTQYRGGTNDSSLDGMWNTMCGKPVTNVNAELLQDYAERNGVRWGASMSCFYFALGVLVRVIFHNRNIQAARNTELTTDGLYQGGLGMGVDNISSSFGSQYATCDIDLLASKGDVTGVFNTTVSKGDGTTQAVNNVPIFFGLKNPYHYITMIQHGMILSANSDYSMDVYSLGTWSSAAVNTNSVSGFSKVGTIPAPPSTSANWQFIKQNNLDNMTNFPIEFGASESTFYSDGFFHPCITSGLRGCGAVLHASHGGSAGLVAGNAGDAPSGASAYWGASLCETDADWDTKSFWVA